MILCVFLRSVHEKIPKLKTTGYNTVSHLCFFATLNKEQKSSYLQLCRGLNGKMLVLGCLYSKSTPIVQQKMRKNQHVKPLRFSLNTNKHKYPKNCPLKIACSAMTPRFCSLTDAKQSLQYTIKTHLSGPPMPKFEANMIYIHPSPPSSMKQCSKSATVKFHMEATSLQCDTIRPCQPCLF